MSERTRRLALFANNLIAIVIARRLYIARTLVERTTDNEMTNKTGFVEGKNAIKLPWAKNVQPPYLFVCDIPFFLLLPNRL